MTVFLIVLVAGLTALDAMLLLLLAASERDCIRLDRHIRRLYDAEARWLTAEAAYLTLRRQQAAAFDTAADQATQLIASDHNG